jgi:hypothetical protein
MMSELKYLLRLSCIAIVVSLMAGCMSTSLKDRLLVDESEVVPVSKLRIRFLTGVPRIDNPTGYQESDLLKILNLNRYLSGEFGNSYVEGMAGSFRVCGVDAGSVKTFLINQKPSALDDVSGYTHSLDIVPKSYRISRISPYPPTYSINAEYQLFDLSMKKMVWKAEDSIYLDDALNHPEQFVPAVSAKIKGVNAAEYHVLTALQGSGFIAPTDYHIESRKLGVFNEIELRRMICKQ